MLSAGTPPIITVFYAGPVLSGCTTSLKALQKRLVGATPIASSDVHHWIQRLELSIAGDRVRVTAATLTGPGVAPALRRQQLRNADAIVFVCDSQYQRAQAHDWFWAEVDAAWSDAPRTAPIVLQYNKRDLPNVLSVGDLDRHLNPHGLPRFESVATKGVGVLEPFKTAAVLAADRRGLSEEVAALLGSA